jgi:hypothetical protein
VAFGNELPDRGFELESWTLTRVGSPGSVDTYADFLTTPVRTGDFNLFLRLDSDAFGFRTAGNAESTDITVTSPGTARQVGGWLQAVNPSTGAPYSDANLELLIQHYPNGTGLPVSNVGTVESTDLSGGWNWVTFDLTPTAANDRIVFAPQQRGGLPQIDSIIWYFDDWFYGDLVAVKLAERGVDATVALLQSNLATELTAIDTERADGITMAAPANGDYYKRPKPEITEATAHVEVFEDAYEFANPYSDAAAQRATYELPITIRVTYFNRDGDTRDTMVTRGRRYAAGVFNVLNKNWDMDDADDATLNGVITNVTPPWVEGDESQPGQAKGRTTLSGVIKCEEIQT